MASWTTQETWLSLITQVLDNDLGSNVEDGLG